MFVGKYIHICTCVGAHISNMWVHRCDKTTSGLFLKYSVGLMLRTSKPRRLEHGKWRGYAKFFLFEGRVQQLSYRMMLGQYSGHCFHI